MKYKRLKTEDLKALEPEFVRFLSAAQITGPDWEKMKREEPLQAEELIGVFSDMVYEKITGKIEYLEYRDELDLKIFHFTKEKVEMVGLKASSGSGVDLRGKIGTETDLAGVKVYSAEKAYVQSRELEVFAMLEQGCQITDHRLFELIRGMI